MKKIHTLLLLFVVLATTNINAQERRFQVGIKAGIVNSWVETNIEGTSSRISPRFGATVDFRILPAYDFYIMSGIDFYSSKGFKADMSQRMSQRVGGKYTYFDIPLHLAYKHRINDKMKLFVSGGGYFGINQVTKVDDDTLIKLRDQLQKTDYGLGASIGIEAYKFRLTAGYDHGLNELVKDRTAGFDFTIKNRSTHLTLGYLF